MNVFNCNKSWQYFPKYAELADLRSTFFANCVFNSFLIYTTIALNIATIYAIHKTSIMAKTLKTLLLSLAFSDVAVGLFIQPLYSFLLIKWLQVDNLNCNISGLLNISGHFFSTASFLGVIAVSVDRLLAIHLHLRYQGLVTHKRVVIVVTGIWVCSAFVSSTILWGLRSTQVLIVTVALAFGFIITFLVYIKIYLAVQRHRNQIQSMQIRNEAQSDEMKNFAVFIKSTVGIFYVFLVYLTCYFPIFITKAAILIYGSNSTLKKLFLFSLTLMYLNSTLNPVIYCWKMRHIRHAIMDILWKMSCKRNQPSRVIYNRQSSVVHVDN
ncbi:histamine H2 receptor-like [Stylophora pistillata]|uniref:histamine H2 receptor-like n=1 Tax=Stylophora pistillata TaxID=50429 RepID=UPI000C052E58|nr:histamine H2 receptor-like [Stylophora pistillata]